MGILYKAGLAIFLLAGIVLLIIGFRIRKKHKDMENKGAAATLCIAFGAMALVIFICGVGVFLYFLSANFEKRKIFKKQSPGMGMMRKHSQAPSGPANFMETGLMKPH